MRKALLGAAYRGPQQEVGEKFGRAHFEATITCRSMTLGCHNPAAMQAYQLHHPCRPVGTRRLHEHCL